MWREKLGGVEEGKTAVENNNFKKSSYLPF